MGSIGQRRSRGGRVIFDSEHSTVPLLHMIAGIVKLTKS